MLTTILFVLALAASIWITALMIARVLYNVSIDDKIKAAKKLMEETNNA